MEHRERCHTQTAVGCEGSRICWRRRGRIVPRCKFATPPVLGSGIPDFISSSISAILSTCTFSTKLAMMSAAGQTGSSPEYQYCPLQGPASIHVVGARIGIHSGDIVCRLSEINLGAPDRPAYKTLSYTWDNPLVSFYEAIPPSPESL